VGKNGFPSRWRAPPACGAFVSPSRSAPVCGRWQSAISASEVLSARGPGFVSLAVDVSSRPVILRRFNLVARNDLLAGKLCNLCPRDDTAELKRLLTAIPPPEVHRQPLLFSIVTGHGLVVTIMKDFANAAFPPEVISVMEAAFDAAVASLPDPVSSTHVQHLAEAILRAAHTGERDPLILQRLALLELQITPR
jgi:hypothetical protein